MDNSKWLVLSLALGSTWAGFTPAPDFTAKCNNDNTLTVTVPFPRTAEILELNYGSCTHNSSTGVEGLTQKPSDLSFEIVLDVAVCGMDQTLRALEYTQHVFIRIGRKSIDMLTGAAAELTYEHYEIDGYCSLDDEYVVIFDYHNLTQVENNANLTGEATVSFMIKAYDDAFNISDFSHSTVAGNFIYLGLTLSDGQVFNFDNLEFAPTKCFIEDTINGFTYTLFNAEISGGCSNPDVDFSIAYDPAKGMWQFTHILFLLGDMDESSFLLACTVKVCQIEADSACDEVKTECGVTTTASESASFSMTSSTTLMAVFENDLTQLDDIVTDSLVPGIIDSLGNIVDSVEVAPGNHSVGSTIVSSYDVNITTTTFNQSRRRRAVALILALLFEDVSFLEELKETLFEEFVVIAEALNITLDVTEFTFDGIAAPENVTCAAGKYPVEGICTVKQCNCYYGVGFTGTDCPNAGDYLCESCDDGYYLNGSTCTFKECNCDNGVAYNGTGCPTNGDDLCESCNNGYYMDGLFCAANVCGCSFGLDVVGENCAEHGDYMYYCDECIEGFHIDFEQECAMNRCTCEHGTAASGRDGCANHEDVLCTSCDEGYHMEGAEGENGVCVLNTCICTGQGQNKAVGDPTITWDHSQFQLVEYSGAANEGDWVTVEEGMQAWGDRNYVYTGIPAFLANDQCRYIRANNHKQMDGTYKVKIHLMKIHFTAYILAESCKPVGWSDHDCNHDGLLHENLMDVSKLTPATPWELIDPSTHDMRHTSNNGGISIFKQDFNLEKRFKFEVELVEPKNDRAWLGGVIICANPGICENDGDRACHMDVSSFDPFG